MAFVAWCGGALAAEPEVVREITVGNPRTEEELRAASRRDVAKE